MTSILQIAQDAAVELSLDKPTSVINTQTSPNGERLFRHITATVKRLGEMNWPQLRREHVFTTEADVVQSGALPVDFERFVPDTFFNRSKRWRVYGPLTAEEWQADRATLMTRVHDSFIQRGTSILLTPTPPAGEEMAFEYITKYVGTDGEGLIPRTRFAADEDVPYLDDELIILGVIWRDRKSESLDYSEEFRSFEMRLSDLYGIQGGRRVTCMGGHSNRRTPVAPIVPDTLVFD